ncbi:MAG: hypothetical protein MGAcid_17740 [uncultured Acidilobus sp. MG]|jgi:hypothetical protein|nr:MAG: hypothetical protein MGAcid_17740 [uncultured Acidilobus sp. MG]
MSCEVMAGLPLGLLRDRGRS